MCCLAMHKWFIYFECKWPNLAPNLQFAYLHILRSATLVTVKLFVHSLCKFYLLSMFRCTVHTLLSLVVQRSCLNVARTGEEDMLRLQFAHFGPFWFKSQSVKRLPHSKFSACACHLFSVTLCLIWVLWPCTDDVYILNVSCQKLARNLLFAYFHPVSVKSQSLKRLPHSQLSAYACYLLSITLGLTRFVWPCIDGSYILNVSGQKLARNLQFAYFHPLSLKSQSVIRLPHSKFSACASRLFSVTLRLICVVWPCIDDL